MLHNLEELNPFAIIGAFLAGPVPECTAVTLRTGNFPNWSTGTGFVTNVDLQSVSPCSFPDGTNPYTNETCREGFSVLAKTPEPEKDSLVGMYTGAVAILGMYIVFNFLEKEHSA